MSAAFSANLPKWPAFLVKGDPVTPQQASQIIVRTTSWNTLWLNDAGWINAIAKAIGIPAEKIAVKPRCKGLSDYFRGEGTDRKDYIRDMLEEDGFMAVFYKRHGVIENLEYLNNSQIGSTWIGGSHGWCDWAGNIQTCNYNIGKWPTVEEVTEGWQKIAKAFPYLNLVCQLCNGETCEDFTQPIVEFRVKNGEVEVSAPTQVLNFSGPRDADLSGFLTNLERERGCNVERLAQALAYSVVE